MEQRKCIGEIYSNFDHAFEDNREELEIELKEDPTAYAGHAAWNYYGRVYFKDGRWCEDVMHYGCLSDTVTAETLEELVEQVKDCYGRE